MTAIARLRSWPTPTARGVATTSARVLVHVGLVALLGGVLASLTVLLVLPRVTQAVPMSVLTGSMTPTIPTGSMVLVRPVEPGTLKVGDIATYQKAPGVETYITHRIVGMDSSVTPPAYLFQGDANRGPDLRPVPPGAIRGEVWFHVPYLGTIKNTLNGPAGMGLLAMLLLGGYALAQVGGALRDRRRPATGEAHEGTRDALAQEPSRARA